MSDFQSETRDVKAVRKSHCCEQCNKLINIGEPAKYSFGIWEGQPFSTHVHVECNDAAQEYATINGLWFEEYPWFQHMDDSEHHAWLLEKHPIVANRLGVEAQPSPNKEGEWMKWLDNLKVRYRWTWIGNVQATSPGKAYTVVWNLYVRGDGKRRADVTGMPYTDFGSIVQVQAAVRAWLNGGPHPDIGHSRQVERKAQLIVFPGGRGE